MTEDKGAVYETIDSLQLQGDYEEIMEIIKYAGAAINNDSPVTGRKVMLSCALVRDNGDIVVEGSPPSRFVCFTQGENDVAETS